MSGPDNSCQVCGSLPVVTRTSTGTQYGPACGHGSFPGPDGMDLTGYDPEAIERAEREMARVIGEMGAVGIKERRQAAAFCAKVLAQLIADDVLLDETPSPRWVAEYRYTRDLAAHLYGQAEASLARIDGR